MSAGPDGRGAPLSHDEVAELLGAYALDAVDADERLLIEDHLRDCPRCREEVGRHREVAAHLAFAGEPAPDGLWERIAADLGERTPIGTGLGELAHPYPLVRARTRRRLATPVLGALAAALVLVVGLLAWQVRSQRSDLNRLQSAAAAEGIDRAAAAAALDVHAVRYALVSGDGTARLEAVVTAGGQGFVVAPSGGLPALGPDRTYQLWAISGSARISLGLLGRHPSVATFTAAGPAPETLAVTDEVAGGVSAPTGSPVVAGRAGVTA